jgi:hypothetical protein
MPPIYASPNYFVQGVMGQVMPGSPEDSPSFERCSTEE